MPIETHTRTKLVVCSAKPSLSAPPAPLGPEVGPSASLVVRVHIVAAIHVADSRYAVTVSVAPPLVTLT